MCIYIYICSSFCIFCHRVIHTPKIYNIKESLLRIYKICKIKKFVFRFCFFLFFFCSTLIVYFLGGRIGVSSESTALLVSTTDTTVATTLSCFSTKLLLRVVVLSLQDEMSVLLVLSL